MGRPTPALVRLQTPSAVSVAASPPPAYEKYQFFNRSESGSKYWVLNARSLQMYVGFFNRATNLSIRSEAWEAQNHGQVTARR